MSNSSTITLTSSRVFDCAAPTTQAGSTVGATGFTVSGSADGSLPFWNSQGNTATVSRTATAGVLYSQRFSFSSAFDGSGSKFLIFPHAAGVTGNTNTYELFDIYNGSNRGVFITLFSGSSGNFSNYKTFAIGRESNTLFPTVGGWRCVFIQPDAPGIAAYSGGSFNSSNIWAFEITASFVSGGTRRIMLYHVMLASAPVVTGGSSADPINSNEFFRVFNTTTIGGFSTARQILGFRIASSGFGLFPLQIGDGVNAFHHEESNADYAFWREADTINDRLCQFADGVLGFNYLPTSTSKLILTNSQIRSIGNRFIRLDLQSVPGFVANLTNVVCTRIKPVILPNQWNHNGGGWTNCGEINLNSGVLTNLTISGSVDISALLANTSCTVSNVVISGNTTGIRIAAAGDYRNINATIANNSAYDVLIDSSVPAGSTINLSNITFPNSSITPVNIRWDGASGSITVVVPRTLTTSTAGGAIVQQTPQLSVTFENILSDSELVIRLSGVQTILYKVVSTGTTESYVYTHTGTDQKVDISVYKEGYQPFRLKNYSLRSTSQVVTVDQPESTAWRASA